MTATEAASLLGLTFGVVGTVLGVLNYLRDRAKVVVTLQWDMSVTPGDRYDANKRWGIIRVANVGRRPIFVSHVAIRVPKGFSHSHLVVNEGIGGVKLTEGDPIQTFVVSQDGLNVYASRWAELVAQVTDASGREWKSKPVAKDSVPSWAKQ